ncbi:MAG: hypothetical protein Q4P33_04335 [Flaviflexus sp.]|nr:hypothetical protein [Flaviflexus sp.]
MTDRSLIPPSVFWVLLLAVFLAGCGAKIDTLLTVDATGKGSRVMTLNLSADDLEEISASIDDIDTSIAQHLPEQLEYSGITESGDGYSATLTMTFTDADDYRSQVQQIFNAGDIPWDENSLIFNSSQEKFVSGVTIIETYTSADLLAWLTNGLVSDGLLDEGNVSNAYELGQTTVSYDGVDYDSFNQVTLDKRVDNGFTDVSSIISLTETGFHREFTFGIDSKAQYTSNSDLYDGHFSEIEELGAQVSKDDSSTGVSWTVAFDAADPAALIDLSNKILSSEESVFTAETAYDSGSITTTITSYAECSTICASGSSATSIRETIVPSTDSSQAGDPPVVETPYSPGTPLETTVRTPLPMENVGLELNLDPTGAVSSIFRFSLPSAEIAGMSQDIADSLLQGGQGAVNSEEQEDNTVFSVKISGDSPEEFTSNYSTWAGFDVNFTVEDVSDTELDGDYYVSGTLPLPGFFSDAEIPVTGTVRIDGGYEINDNLAPVPQAGEEGNTLTDTVQAGGLNVEVLLDKKPAILPWILLGLALILIPAIMIFFIIRKRKKVAAATTNYPVQPEGHYPYRGADPSAGAYPQAPGGPPVAPGEAAHAQPPIHPPAPHHGFQPGSEEMMNGHGGAPEQGRRDTEQYPS